MGSTTCTLSCMDIIYLSNLKKMIPADAYDFRKGGVVRGEAEFDDDVTMGKLNLTDGIENKDLRLELDDKIKMWGDVEITGMLHASNIIEVGQEVLPDNPVFNRVIANNF